MSYLTNPESGLPPRGTVLCIFQDSAAASTLEKQFVSKGYTVLRARHGMHGYWLAISSKPNVIITDLIDPTQESDYVIELLHRNHKTRSLPVVALVDDVRQTAPTKSCLAAVDVCLRADTPVDAIIEQLDTLVERNQICQQREAKPTQRETTSRHGVYTRFDEYFARLGDSELRRLLPKSRPRGTASKRRRSGLPDQSLAGQVD